MGAVKGFMMDAQEFVWEYMDETGKMKVTLAELLKKAQEEKGMFFADCVKAEYKEMMEGW